MEKPLWAQKKEDILNLEKLAQSKNVQCYSAYNHRFEPHIIKLKKLIDSGKLGKLYSCRFFYGNGTSALVKASPWRDSGKGVILDLGSHLLDMCNFLFKIENLKFKLLSSNTFETNSPDHAVIFANQENFRIELEMTMCMWRNHFTCDILAENGSVHIESLCKWGPSIFINRKRVKPSGRPTEKTKTLIQNDPTWKNEFNHFKNLIKSKQRTDLQKDIWLFETINFLGKG